MRWWMLCVAATCCAQTFEVKPDVVRQGETVHVTGPESAQTARLNGRTIQLFSQPGGGVLGLMPVPVAQKPGLFKLEFLDKSGAVLHSSRLEVRAAHYPSQNIVLGKGLTELKPSPGEVEETMTFRKTVSPIRFWEEPLQLPVDGCMTSLFGVRRFQNGKPTGGFHGGIDQRGTAGSQIRAAASGVVKLARIYNLHGGTVAIDHGQGFGSMYLHMSKFDVTEGQTVHQGDVIGSIGSTGRSTAPHLHWSLYVQGTPVSPLQWVHVQPCPAPVRHTRRKRRGR